MLASKNTKILVSMPQKLSDEVTEFAKELNQNKSALINQAFPNGMKRTLLFKLCVLVDQADKM